jgi:hypothetical protein
MVKSCVFFAVRTEFLNIISMSFDFKGLVADSNLVTLCGIPGAIIVQYKLE